MWGRRIGVRRGAARSWRWMLLLALIGMALSSLGGAIAASQANPPIEQEEQADQPAVETAEPSETQPPDTGEATEPAMAPPEGPGGQQVNQPPVGRESADPPFFLQLVKRVCPAKEGFVPGSTPYAELDDACRLEVADPASFFFIVIDASGQEHVANDLAPFFELPTGRTRAWEKHAGGYGDPIVWCSFGKGEPPARMEVVDRGVTLDPKPEMLVTCEFFNPELPPDMPTGDGTGSITVVKVACPPGYEPTGRGADPTKDCTKLLDEVGFSLLPADPGVEPRKGVTGANGRGTLIFDGLPAGRYTVEERLPEGYTSALVWMCTDDPRRLDAAGAPLATGTRVELDLAEGQDLWCLWLNLVEKSPSEPTPEPTPTSEPTEPIGDGSSLTLYKWECPEGSSGEQDLDWYASSCELEMMGVPFELTSVNGTTAVMSQANGTHFDDLPAGSITLREEIPDGYGAPRVFCELVNMTPPTERPVIDGAIELEIDGDAGDIICHWYNIPEPSAAAAPLPTESGFVIDPNAPAGTTPTASAPEPTLPMPWTPAPDVATVAPTERAASGPGDLVVIVTDADGNAVGGACVALIGSDGETVAEGCDTADWEQASLAGNGATGFFGVPAGDYTVRLVSTPDGGTADDVAATVMAGESTQVMVTVGAPASAAEAPETAETATGGVITVLKVTCPEGIGIEDLDAGTVDDCARPTDGISFTLAGADGEVSQRGRTGDNGRGTITFAGIPAGTYEIVEARPPAGTGTVVWACLEDPRELGSVTEPLARGTSVTVELEAGHRLTCLWINAETSEETAAVVPTPVVAVPAEPLPPDDPETDTPVAALPGAPGLPIVPGGPYLDLAVGEVTISAFACDPGFSRAAYYPVSLDDLHAGCTQPFADLPFFLDGANDAGPRTTGAEGSIAFANLALGDTTINQVPVSGYTYPIVYCSDAGASPAEHSPEEQVLRIYHTTVTLATDAPAETCEWFAIPLTDDFHLERIEFAAYQCEGLGAEEIPSAEVCGPVEGSYTLTVSGDQGWEYSWTLGPGIQRPPSPSDQALAISVDMPPGWDSMLASCRVVDWVDRGTVVHDLGWLEVSEAGTVTVPPIGMNNALACDWYTIAGSASGELPSSEPTADDPEALAGSGRVYLWMYLCPPGSTYNTIAAAWLDGDRDTCGRVAGEATTLTHANASGTGDIERPRETGANGSVFWGDGVPQGPWSLTSPPGSGMGNPLVICAYENPPEGVDAGWRVSTDVLGGVYNDAFVAADMYAECHWFAIPTVDPGGSNRVRLTVYDCPQGTTADAIVAAWPAAIGGGACAPDEGVKVTLRYADASGVGEVARPLVTDANGVAFWSDGVPTAPWSLSRADGSDASALVACRYDALPGAEPEWRFSPVVADGVFASSFAGVYDHPPEQQADLLDRCHWFSIP